MNRRIVTLLAALVPVVVLAVVGSVVQVPFVALGPGPTFDTLGEVDGTPVVDIEGTEVDPTTGHLNMTTVAVRDGLNVFEALGLWLSGRQGLVPRSEVYPPDRSRDEIQEENTADFQQSESTAEVAAMRYLGQPVVVEVGSVAQDGPSNGILRENDRLLTVDGVPVDTVAGVQEIVAAKGAGAAVPVTFVRDGTEQTATVVLGARPDDPGKGYLGVTPVEQADVPFTIDFNLADIGGPSAGLMFTLAVIDKLTPGELNGGAFVAGTGTITSDGTVGPIGGIQHKIVAADEAGAETFLVPARNCDEAKQGAPDGLRLVKVDTLATAVDALGAIDRGEPAPVC
ncbi:PDZ domain-containing protein [Rhodococcus sp. HNM0569]|uniref:S16 family serine protease n=1 Tax=Rhodococcus sp. HNM0569 TaxID=2716340 RepID=UPI00146B6496|nr:PDZ domain-containing protein [Rhodococcus sp. HNM0569]